LSFNRFFLEFVKSLFVPVVVVLEQLILIIVIECDDRSACGLKVEKITSGEVGLVNFLWQRLQRKDNVDLINLLSGVSSPYEAREEPIQSF